jgi:hypothetical protein
MVGGFIDNKLIWMWMKADEAYFMALSQMEEDHKKPNYLAGL